jgi:hypothetical protein
MYLIFPGGLRKIYARFAKSLHWNPVGKRVRLTVAEALDRSMFGKSFAGTIIRTVLDDTGYHVITQEECPVIHLDHPLTIYNKHFDIVIAKPRHTGYDLYSLLFTSIGVYVNPIPDLDDLDAYLPTKAKDIIGIWLLSTGCSKWWSILNWLAFFLALGIILLLYIRWLWLSYIG